MYPDDEQDGVAEALAVEPEESAVETNAAAAEATVAEDVTLLGNVCVVCERPRAPGCLSRPLWCGRCCPHPDCKAA